MTATTVGAASDGRVMPPTAKPVPAIAAPYRATARRPTAGWIGSLPVRATPVARATATSPTATPIAEPHGDAAGKRPSHAGERGRQEQLEPAARLIGGPAGDKRGGGQPDERQAHLDEHELEESGRCRQIDARDHPLEGLKDARRTPQLLDERRARHGHHEAVQPESEAPPGGRWEQLPEGPTHRAANPEHAPAAAAASGPRSSPRCRVARRPRCRSSTRTIVTRATRASDGQSSRPASGTWLRVQANQASVGRTVERRDDCPIAVEQIAGEHDSAGESGRRTPAKDRGQRERDGTGDEGLQPHGGHERDRRAGIDRVGLEGGEATHPSARSARQGSPLRSPRRPCGRPASGRRGRAATVAWRRRSRGCRASLRPRGSTRGQGSTRGRRAARSRRRSAMR